GRTWGQSPLRGQSPVQSLALAGECAVAVFELLPRSAWARLVAADFAGIANELRDLRGTLRVFFGLRLRRGHLLGRGVLELHGARETTLTRLLFGVDLSLRTQLHPRQHRHGVVLHAVEHRSEQLERLALVLLLGILLRVAAQMDTLTQVIHRSQMLAPM